MQTGDIDRCLDDIMQQLALICSFASFQPAAAEKLPEDLAAMAAHLTQLPDEHMYGLRDLARLIDGYLMKNRSSRLPIAKQAQVVLTTQHVPRGSSSGSESGEDSEHTWQQSTAAAKPVNPARSSYTPSAHVSKAAAMGSKQSQGEGNPAAAAMSRELHVLTDAVRTAPSPANISDQRAASKRLQLRMKLKRAHEAARAGLTHAAAEVQTAVDDSTPPAADSPGLSREPSEKLVSMDLSSNATHSSQPSGAGATDAAALKPSKKMLKRERRRAAAAAAAVAETAASGDTLQPDAARSTQRPSTAEGTSSSSAASLVSSPDKREAEEHPESATPSIDADVPSISTHDGDVIDRQPEVAATDDMAAPGALQAQISAAADSLQEVAVQNKPQEGSVIAHLAQPDSKAVSLEPDPGPAETSTEPQVSEQEHGQAIDSASMKGPDAAQPGEVPQPAAAQPGEVLQPAAAQLASPLEASNSTAPTASTSGTAGATISNAGSAAETASGTEAKMQAAARQEQKPEEPPAGMAAPTPASIAAHRPPAKKVVLRASAAPYTPLSSKAALADKGKAAAPATGVKHTAPVAGGKPPMPAAAVRPAVAPASVRQNAPPTSARLAAPLNAARPAAPPASARPAAARASQGKPAAPAAGNKLAASQQDKGKAAGGSGALVKPAISSSGSAKEDKGKKAISGIALCLSAGRFASHVYVSVLPLFVAQLAHSF